jgi:hypothetical protein
MSCTSRQSIGVILVLAALLTVGCIKPVDTSMQYPRRSMVFDSPRLRHKSEQLATTVPWYANRNDRRRYVYSGYSVERSEWTKSRTVDRQYHRSGRVLDYHQSRTITQGSVHTAD